MSRKFLPALLVVLCAVSPSLAQTQSDDVVRITINLVQIDVVVTKNGKPIKDLKAEDFEVFEDGRRQGSPASPISPPSRTTRAL